MENPKKFIKQSLFEDKDLRMKKIAFIKINSSKLQSNH